LAVVFFYILFGSKAYDTMTIFEVFSHHSSLFFVFCRLGPLGFRRARGGAGGQQACRTSGGRQRRILWRSAIFRFFSELVGGDAPARPLQRASFLLFRISWSNGIMGEEKHVIFTFFLSVIHSQHVRAKTKKKKGRRGRARARRFFKKGKIKMNYTKEREKREEERFLSAVRTAKRSLHFWTDQRNRTTAASRLYGHFGNAALFV
jgi:hypothetical protein